MAIAGALVATGQAHAAVKVPARATTVVEQINTDAAVRHDQPASRSYTVQPGDTLSSIAHRFYGNPAHWHVLYQVNRSVIRNPDAIYQGQVLKIPYNPPASTTTASRPLSRTPSGTLSCPGLEQLWVQAGGSRAQAVMAAKIAMAESSGQQYATGAAGERGYWQINPNHGPLSTYDPLGNARAAVLISGNGTNWTPWTTYTSGAYLGRC
jgi:LysM repeat protein